MSTTSIGNATEKIKKDNLTPEIVDVNAMQMKSEVTTDSNVEFSVKIQD